MKRLVLLLAFIMVIMPSILMADLYLKSVSHTDAFEMMGQRQEASTTTQEVWIGENNIRVDSEGSTILFDLENNDFYVIYHDQKAYFHTSLPIDLKSIVPEEQAGMMDMMKFEVSVEPLDEERKIQDWNCRAYKMEMKSQMVNIISTIWATEDIQIDQEKLNSFYKNTAALQNITGASLAEFAKIKGVQVLQESTSEIMGSSVKQKTELSIAEEREVPGDHYSIPEGYQEMDQFAPVE